MKEVVADVAAAVVVVPWWDGSPLLRPLVLLQDRVVVIWREGRLSCEKDLGAAGTGGSGR